MTINHFEYMRKMRKVYEAWDGSRVSPYHFDSFAGFPKTLIESNLWSDFRQNGIPMYYQFPIGKYYADFCDPFNGLVVEADGKIHEQFAERDNVRDEYIKSLGFQVLRIPGRDTFNRDVETEYGTYRASPGLETVQDWYGGRPRRPDMMPWDRFAVWKKSLGIVADRDDYDRRVEMHEELDALYEKEGIVSFAQVSEIMDKYL